MVPFPFSDRLAEKRRPAVVVSEILASGHVRLAMVTSAVHAPWSFDVPVHDLDAAGLPAPSVIRSAKLATTETGRLLKVIGKLDHRTAAALREALLAGIPSVD
ncbi:MAG: type II toxin-antitoxin system PemK/MazF family toxin [Beijerinckiaceae bacterium]